MKTISNSASLTISFKIKSLKAKSDAELSIFKVENFSKNSKFQYLYMLLVWCVKINMIMKEKENIPNICVGQQ